MKTNGSLCATNVAFDFPVSTTLTVDDTGRSGKVQPCRYEPYRSRGLNHCNRSCCSPTKYAKRRRGQSFVVSHRSESHFARYARRSVRVVAQARRARRIRPCDSSTRKSTEKAHAPFRWHSHSCTSEPQRTIVVRNFTRLHAGGCRCYCYLVRCISAGFFFFFFFQIHK